MSFYNNFLYLCKQKNVLPTVAVVDMGFQKSVATRWKNGTVPRDFNLLKVADYFGVSVDELLSDNAADTKKETAEIIDSPKEAERRQLLRQAMEMASTLSDDKLRRLIEILKTK